ncbi:MAG: 4'-phosphopantetheinyl transferase superfamily protein [Clostridia bacterium]|nr:4'-phosphopantetheinyl transferase superfamily protein [Clostridia bacterium]
MLKVKYDRVNYDGIKLARDKKALEHNSAYELLYKMLEELFGIRNPKILKTHNGKPYIEIDGIHFSISHTDGLVVCAVSDSPVGVDAERLSRRTDIRIDSFSKRYFTENEQSYLASSEDKRLAFYKIWCGKEATIKKLGGTIAYLKRIDTTEENFQYIYMDDYVICIKN